MSRSIGVFGAGPGLGQAVARRYAQEGYRVVLVGRRREPLEALAQDLIAGGATAHVVTADLSDVAAAPALAEQVRAVVGDLDADPRRADAGRRVRPCRGPDPGAGGSVHAAGRLLAADARAGSSCRHDRAG